MDLAIRMDAPGAAQIDDADLAPIQEIRRADLLVRVELDGPRKRRCAAHHQPVDMAVGQLDLSGNEQLLDQEVAAQVGRAEMADGLRVAYLPDVDGHESLLNDEDQRKRAGSQSDRPGM